MTNFNYILCILAMIWMRKGMVLAVSSNTPIIFVHGYMSNPSAWSTADDFFRSHNYNNIYKFNYENTTTESIVENSDRLWQFLMDEKLTDSELILIGHCSGGLVARDMAASHPELKVVKLITLATPNYGAIYANLCPPGICSDALWDMRSQSLFLRDLNGRTEYKYTEDEVLTYAIDGDEVIFSGSAYIDRALHLAINSNAVDVDHGVHTLNGTLNNMNDMCVINGTWSTTSNTRGGLMNGETCIVEGTICESNGMLCQINDTLGNLTDSTCELQGTKCTIDTFGNLAKVHASIKNKQEVLNNVLRFIRGQVKIIEGGPMLHDGSCAYIFKNSSTVGWDLPTDSPSSLQMNVLQDKYSNDVLFDNVDAKHQIREHMLKGTFKFRFFDPESTTLTRWSSVEFKNVGPRCQSNISNHQNIVKTWPK